MVDYQVTKKLKGKRWFYGYSLRGLVVRNVLKMVRET
jgi:hypothetical protein